MFRTLENRRGWFLEDFLVIENHEVQKCKGEKSLNIPFL